jgi:hypothetical protein
MNVDYSPEPAADTGPVQAGKALALVAHGDSRVAPLECMDVGERLGLRSSRTPVMSTAVARFVRPVTVNVLTTPWRRTASFRRR